ncbi:MAG: RNA methyltransferase [Candidatus Dadabacteria bacterium]|nr:MAG: RNA methyltransferase [Candidatus Dadabacteria bacterium]
MHPTIVLVEPLYGGNLGSVARAMANFGLRDLVLVNPAPGIFDDPRLEPMARKAVELVRNARVVPDLFEALRDVELALGFTTRLGRRRNDGLELRPAVAELARHHAGARVAAVFGREDAGLTTAELDLCHWLVRIPTDRGLPSLNLAQAVGLFCYEVRLANLAARPESEPYRPATVAEMEGLYAHFEKVLWDIGFIEEASPERMMNQIRRIFSRRLPTSRDVRILRGILSKVEWKLGLPKSR